MTFIYLFIYFIENYKKYIYIYIYLNKKNIKKKTYKKELLKAKSIKSHVLLHYFHLCFFVSVFLYLKRKFNPKKLYIYIYIY